MAKAFLLVCLLMTLTVLALRNWNRFAPGAPSPAALLPVPPPAAHPTASEAAALRARLQARARSLRAYAAAQQYSQRTAFLVDMSRPSGSYRFFIYDLAGDSILRAGLVAHGSCNRSWADSAQFANEVGCGCSSLGRYRVGAAYPGRFGTAFKLHGLDPSNSNAYARFVVLHAYDCVPDRAIDPLPLCNSLGCPMVSYRFLETAAGFIRKEKRPILLWIFN
ncbi:murein L,D-transpeptidase catalytic domain-containing protein [Flaviaesturariibacter terrae]